MKSSNDKQNAAKAASESRMWQAALNGGMGASASRRDRAKYQDQIVAYAKQHDVELLRVMESEDKISNVAKAMFGRSFEYMQYKAAMGKSADGAQEEEDKQDTVTLFRNV